MQWAGCIKQTLKLERWLHKEPLLKSPYETVLNCRCSYKDGASWCTLPNFPPSFSPFRPSCHDPSEITQGPFLLLLFLAVRLWWLRGHELPRGP